MKRRLLGTLSIISLLLCISVAALWARSCWVWDHLRRAGPQSLFEVSSLRGTIVCGLIRYDDPQYGYGDVAWEFVAGTTEGVSGGIDAKEESAAWRITPVGSAFPTQDKPYLRSAQFLGAGFVINHGPYGIDYRSVFVPHWLLLVLFGLLPLAWFKRFIRERHRNANGLCATCGYDLRESPDRCPECGMVKAARN